MKRSNLVLRSVARWLVLGFMVSALSGCGDPAVTSIPQSELQKPEVQQQVAQAAGVPIEVVQEAVALQIAYEQAIAEQANPTPSTVVEKVARYITPKSAFAKEDDTNKSAQVKEVKDEKENNGKNDCNKNKNEDNNHGNNNSNGNNHACTDDDTTKVVTPPVVTPPVVNPPVVVTQVVQAKVYSLASTVPFVKGVETNIQLTYNQGTAPYVFSATNLPLGLVLSSTGIITGKPALAGVSAANIIMVDAKGVVYKRAMVSITAIHQPLSNVVLPPFKRGTVSSLQLVPDSATGPYTFLGITPNGTRVNATGMIYGNPVSVGTSSAILITKNSYNDIAIKIAPVTVQ
jgi:hypothetical protein